MDTSQKTLLCHDDLEAEVLSQRIKQIKIKEQNTREKSSEHDQVDTQSFRYLCSQNFC